MTRRRKPDATKCTGKNSVGFRQGESWPERHARRLKAALEHRQSVENWCGRNGLELTITNRGQHWVFRKGQRIAEWWPSSAKLVIDQKYGRGIHTHDWAQLLLQLDKAFN